MRVRTLAVIRIYDEPSDLTFVFDDLVRFHGTKSICGLTVSFKVMEAAWQELWTGAPPRSEGLLIIHDLRFITYIAGGHDKRPAEEVDQDTVQGGVGKHPPLP